ncbi:replication-relaxation family protein [Frankia sp. AgB1.9]|uniref:replication-relaxation family protein n=1 Tax=Frankia sp. AgW1.1 TaxID=1836971 RepID=UPI0019317167|nr:replication-relaxation family protein [Frankia sp. AgW1.1]MBL7547925.1 replication-relaxation family protein [Frankia sp. AgB1.9]
MTQLSVLSSVARFGQITSSQLQRLHYQGTAESARTRANRHQRRLVSLGLVRRIWGIYPLDHPAQGVFTPPKDRGRADPHRLDITELYVRLATVQVPEAYWVEKPRRICVTPFTPDAYAIVGGGHFFIEVDRATEHDEKIKGKFRRYVQVYHSWDVETDGPIMPLVVWTVPDRERRRELESYARKSGERGLFVVVLFDEAARYLLDNR